MERINATECILTELGKFDPRCKRRDEIENKDNLTNYPLISDIVEYFVNLDYKPLYDGEINEESIYKTFMRDKENVIISFNGISIFEDIEYTFAKITIKKDETLIEITRPWMKNFQNFDEEHFGKSQIILTNEKITKNIFYRDENGNEVWDYKYSLFNQNNEPYYYGFGRIVNGERKYEARLETLNIDYEDRMMFTYDSVDKLNPYSKVKGNVVGALFGTNAVNTVERIYVSLKSETELRLEHAKKKEAKRIRKHSKRTKVED